MTVCPTCQGAGRILGHNPQAGMPRRSFSCRTCWGTRTATVPDGHPDKVRADRYLADGYEPVIESLGGPFGYPRSFAGWRRREAV